MNEGLIFKDEGPDLRLLAKLCAELQSNSVMFNVVRTGRGEYRLTITSGA